MKRFGALLIGLSVIALISGCAGKPRSADVREDLDAKWEDQVGKATKAEFVEDFGSAQWCRPSDAGGEVCRFRRNKGNRWMGDKLDRKVVEMYDEVLATFDPGGKLRSYKVKTQR